MAETPSRKACIYHTDSIDFVVQAPRCTALVSNQALRASVVGSSKKSENWRLLHFLGRRDAQVKIHGHRVDLLEVQASILDSCSRDVAAVHVSMVPFESGMKKMVAYIIPANGSGVGVFPEFGPRSLRVSLIT